MSRLASVRTHLSRRERIYTGDGVKTCGLESYVDPYPVGR